MFPENDNIWNPQLRHIVTTGNEMKCLYFDYYHLPHLDPAPHPHLFLMLTPLQLSCHIHPSSALPPSELFWLSTSKTSLFFTPVYFHVCDCLFVQAWVKWQICRRSSNAILCSLHTIHALSLSTMGFCVSTLTRKKGDVTFVCVLSFISHPEPGGRTR